MTEALTQEEIQDLADRWYKALDVHVIAERAAEMIKEAHGLHRAAVATGMAAG